MEVNVEDVDEDCYSFLDLFDDAMKAFDIEPGLVLSFQDKKGYFIENDKDILSMFERFSTELVIPISVAVVGGPTAFMPPVVEVDDDVEFIPEEEFVANAAEESISYPDLQCNQQNDPHPEVHEAEANQHPKTHPDPQEPPEISHNLKVNLNQKRRRVRRKRLKRAKRIVNID